MTGISTSSIIFKLKLQLICKDEEGSYDVLCGGRLTTTGTFQSAFFMNESVSTRFLAPGQRSLWVQGLICDRGSAASPLLTRLKEQAELTKEGNESRRGVKAGTMSRVWTVRFFPRRFCLIREPRSRVNSKTSSQWASRCSDMPPPCLLSMLIPHFHSFSHTISLCCVLGSSYTLENVCFFAWIASNTSYVTLTISRFLDI